jgi:hypothetical protein
LPTKHTKHPKEEKPVLPVLVLIRAIRLILATASRQWFFSDFQKIVVLVAAKE